MKYTVTLTPSEWMVLLTFLIDQEVRAERDAADPDLECIKSYNEHDAARARDLQAILRDPPTYYGGGRSMRTTEIWNLDTLLTDEELELLNVAISDAVSEYRNLNMTEITRKLIKLRTQLVTDAHPYHPEEGFEND